jgi:osmotically inducible lipoprotein OsmB
VDRTDEETKAMKKLLILSLAATAALALAGCDTPQGQNAANGALLGGATGAVLGGVLTGKPVGALVGGVAGATTGAMIGSASTPPGPGSQCAEWYYDYYGNRVCRSWY